MNTNTLAIAGIAALAIVVIAIGVAMSGRSSISDRLERYAAAAKTNEAGGKGTSGSGGVAELIAQSQALAAVNKAVRAAARKQQVSINAYCQTVLARAVARSAKHVAVAPKETN